MQKLSFIDMRIKEFEYKPVQTLRFLNSGRGPGSCYVDALPIHLGKIEGLPEELDAIIVTADLQGRETFKEANGQPPRLLGEVLPQRLWNEIFPELGLDIQRAAAILAGDFYTVPNLDRRGGTGDVLDVWRAFANEFDWIAGVAGNHDMFGPKDQDRSDVPRNAKLLKSDCVKLDSVKIGGVDGIIGDPRKHNRWSMEDYLFELSEILDQDPVVVVTHDGPNSPATKGRGYDAIRELLEFPILNIRGHSHWDPPFVEFASGLQVLNVDARVAILIKDS